MYRDKNRYLIEQKNIMLYHKLVMRPEGVNLFIHKYISALYHCSYQYLPDEFQYLFLDVFTTKYVWNLLIDIHYIDMARKQSTKPIGGECDEHIREVGLYMYNYIEKLGYYDFYDHVDHEKFSDEIYAIASHTAKHENLFIKTLEKCVGRDIINTLNAYSNVLEELKYAPGSIEFHKAKADFEEKATDQ